MGSEESEPPLFASSVEETGRASIDYFSWGHIDLGIGCFLILSLINTLPSYFEDELIYLIPYWLMLVIVFAVTICWEILENTVFVEIGIKFEDRPDSPVNALADIIFGMIGGFAMWILKGVLVNIFGARSNNAPLYIIYFYVIGVAWFFVLLICFFINRAITKGKS